MSEIKQRVLDVMAAIFEMSTANIPSNAAPGVVANWDSLKHMSLILALEEEFEFRFTDDEITDLLNLDLILSIVSAKLGSKS
jgi:acyl carrier protein